MAIKTISNNGMSRLLQILILPAVSILGFWQIRQYYEKTFTG